MATEGRATAASVDKTPTPRPGETGLRKRESAAVVYITPTAAEVEHRWHLWRREGPTDLERRPADPAEVVDIAGDPRTDRVDVLDTPAWPVALV